MLGTLTTPIYCNTTHTLKHDSEQAGTEVTVASDHFNRTHLNNASKQNTLYSMYFARKDV